MKNGVRSVSVFIINWVDQSELNHNTFNSTNGYMITVAGTYVMIVKLTEIFLARIKINGGEQLQTLEPNKHPTQYDLVLGIVIDSWPLGD